MEETGNIPTSMGIGIKSNMLKEVFKYKRTIPVRNVKYNKSKLYEQMLPMVVFIAVDADPKIKAKINENNKNNFLSLFLSSGCYAAVITSEGSFKHDGNNFSPRQACEIAKKRAKEKAIIDALGLNISLEEVQKCDETDGKFDCRSNQVSIKSLNGEITEMKVIDKNEGIEELADIKLYYCKVVIQANVEQKIIEDKNLTFK